jgi:hypothetical protein
VYFCESCGGPVTITTAQCPKCDQVNPNYDPSILSSAPAGKPGQRPVQDIEAEIDEESNVLAKQIAELRQACTPKKTGRDKNTQRGRPAVKRVKNVNEASLEVLSEPAVDESHLLVQSMPFSSADLEPVDNKKQETIIATWDCDLLVHSQNRKEPIHVGLGTNPSIARGIPGTIFFTKGMLIFVSYQARIDKVRDVFAYCTAAIENLSKYQLGPGLHDNTLEFTSHGLFKKHFPGPSTFFVNFTWSKDPAAGDIDNQMFAFKSTIDRLQQFKAETRLLGGDIVFLTGVPPNDPHVQDILVELRRVASIVDEIKRKYPI